MAFSKQAAPELGMATAAPALSEGPDSCRGHTLWAQEPSQAQKGHKCRPDSGESIREQPRRVALLVTSFLKIFYSANPKDLCPGHSGCGSLMSQTVLCPHCTKEGTAT